MTEPVYDPAAYRIHLATMWGFVTLIEPLPLEAMIAHAERAELIGPYVDPTAWMHNRVPAQQDLAMLRAVRGVQTAFATMKVAHEARQAKNAPANPNPSSRPREEGSGASGGQS